MLPALQVSCRHCTRGQGLEISWHLQESPEIGISPFLQTYSKKKATHRIPVLFGIISPLLVIPRERVYNGNRTPQQDESLQPLSTQPVRALQKSQGTNINTIDTNQKLLAHIPG